MLNKNFRTDDLGGNANVVELNPLREGLVCYILLLFLYKVLCPAAKIDPTCLV